MTLLEQLETKVLLERLVIGLEEPVLIKGLGELQAKIDSGNGGYNVIHGTDFHQQGNELMFTTNDSFGHEKKMQATVIDTIQVNMGGGNIENRPVIELDIKFGGEDYRKIPFSVSDRSSNTNPILISKGFVENELEALIDVGAKNISNDGIEVVYGEGFLGTVGSGLLKGATGLAKGAWDAGKGIAKAGVSAVKNAGDILQGKQGALSGVKQGLGDTLKAAGGAATGAAVAGLAALGGVGLSMYYLYKGANGARKLIKAAWAARIIAQSKKILENDTKQIRTKLNGLSFHKNFTNDETLDTSANIVKLWGLGKVNYEDLAIVPVTSYMMKKGQVDSKLIIKGLETKEKSLQQWLANNKKAVNAMKQNGQPTNNEQQEQEVFTEAVLLMEEGQAAPAAPTPPTPPTPQPTTPTDATGGQKDETKGQTPTQSPQTQEAEKELEEQTTFLHNLGNFGLWFIPLRSDKAYLENLKKQLAQAQEKLEQIKQSKPENNSTDTDPQLVTQSFEQTGNVLNEMLDYRTAAAMDSQRKEKDDFDNKSHEEKIAEMEKKIKTLQDRIKIGIQPKQKDAYDGAYKIITKGLNIDGILKELFKTSQVDQNTVQPIVQKLAKECQKHAQNTGAHWGQGLFCLSWSTMSQDDNAYKADNFLEGRQFHFFESPQCISLVRTKQATDQQQQDAWINDKLNSLRNV